MKPNLRDTHIVVSQCMSCKHLDRKGTPNNPTCTAFKEGIPKELLFGTRSSEFTDDLVHISHKLPFPGDNGMQYTAMNET